MLNLVINSQLWPPCEQRNIIPFAFVSCICSEMGVVLYNIWNPWQRTFQPSCGWTVYMHLVHNALPAAMHGCFSGVGVELNWTSLWCEYCSIVSREQSYVLFLVVFYFFLFFYFFYGNRFMQQQRSQEDSYIHKRLIANINLGPCTKTKTLHSKYI